MAHHAGSYTLGKDPLFGNSANQLSFYWVNMICVFKRSFWLQWEFIFQINMYWVPTMGQVLVCALSIQQWKKMERAPIFDDLIENTPIVHKMMRSATKNLGTNKRVGWSWFFISLSHLKLLIFLHHFFFKTQNDIRIMGQPGLMTLEFY